MKLKGITYVKVIVVPDRIQQDRNEKKTKYHEKYQNKNDLKKYLQSKRPGRGQAKK